MSDLERRTSNWVKAAAIAGSVAVAGIPDYISRDEKINKNQENDSRYKTKIESASLKKEKPVKQNFWIILFSKILKTSYSITFQENV